MYEHAHKLHHYLHGTLSFDAHIYGNGMPEEFFFMLLEVLAGTVYGITPATLNKLILQYRYISRAIQDWIQVKVKKQYFKF